MNVGVVGGGIAGLAAAWELVTGPATAEVTIFEPERIGGKIATDDFGGHPVDLGADSFIARLPHAIRLCRELGIEAELVAPAANQALLWLDGRLRPLPAGLVLGVPGRLGPLLSSGLLTTSGLLRAGLDLIRPATPSSGDAAVADVVGRRFGRQVVDRLVDPLLGGIHAGSTDRLSVEATAPQLADAARTHRSLLIGLRRLPAPGAGPLFLAPRGGMGRLVERLVDALKAKGVGFATAGVTSLQRAAPGVLLEPGGRFDRVVLATPPAVTARLLTEVAPQAAAGLAAIRTASVVLTTLAYPVGSLRIPEGASGLLVPRTERRLMTACSFGSSKWPHWSDSGEMVLRVSAGKDSDDRALHLDDDALVDCLHGELAEALEATAQPIRRRVSRWPNAFPQYDVGHLDRVDRIEQALVSEIPEVAIAGAGYRGSGVPACIASGRQAATMVASAR